MRGIVIKDHNEPTAPLAYHLRQVVPGLELYGGFVLNLPNGGANKRRRQGFVDRRFELEERRGARPRLLEDRTPQVS
jgi:hypothetical protein